MRHLHYFDPQLIDWTGHYAGYCEQAVRELQRRGVPVTVYARRSCGVTVAGVKPEPVFSHDIFKEAGQDPQTWAMENFHTINRAFLADLVQLAPERFSRDDVIFLPSVIENQLHGLAQWLGRLPEARRPAVVVLLRYLNEGMEHVRNRENRNLISLHYRFAARELRKVQPRSILAADTAEMAQAYRAIIGLEILQLPIAMEPPASLAAAPSRPADGRPTIVYLGHTSPLRGFQFLPEIVERCGNLPTRPLFAIQIQNRPLIEAAGLGPLVKRLEGFGADRVRLTEGALTSADYFSLLAEADVVLLPYSPAFYGHCSSGIFAEAAALGKVIVVPAATVSARQGRDYRLGVVAADAWTPPSLAAALAKALAALPELRAQASAGAERFQREQSARAFWERLTAELTPAAIPSSVAA